MNILAIDTATEAMGIALRRANGQTLSLSVTRGYQHATGLLPWIEQILEKGEVPVKELDLIACSIGPGSFTGLRIGLSTAKGLASGTGCPIVGIDTLEAMAYPYRFFTGLIVPVIDAKKKRFYSAFFSEGERITKDMDISADDLKKQLCSHDNVLLTGPGADKIYNPEEHFMLDPRHNLASPVGLIELGKKKFEKSDSDGDALSPIYLRKSEAEISLYGEK